MMRVPIRPLLPVTITTCFPWFIATSLIFLKDSMSEKKIYKLFFSPGYD